MKRSPGGKLQKSLEYYLSRNVEKMNAVQDAHPSVYRSQIEDAAECLRFLNEDADCFERSNVYGHFTGSALIVDPVKRKLLLVHHKKLDKWLQPGGHCDGISDPFFTAWQESFQETGLKTIVPLDPWSIIDIDIRPYPEHAGVPEHLHYDVRYLFSADSEAFHAASDESNDIAWVSPEDLDQYSTETPLQRLVDTYFA